ncbi:MAG: zinc ribbon domain-containing protein [Blastocatellia bacterium]
MFAAVIGEYQEHHFRRVIPGDIETVRRKLCDVLEDFNLVVLNENPIQAKRPAQKNVITATVIEYDARLTIALKAISPASTLATFDYAVPYLYGKGDRIALECEADAIIALATTVFNETLCARCGAENAGKVRFCRVCGTPVAHKLPAELEVMRLTAELSATYIEVGWGVVIVLLTLLSTLPMILFGNPKVVNIGWVLFAIGENLGWFMLLSGLFRLRRTITTTGAEQNQQPELPYTAATQERAALPPTPASVTEGTTELMNQPQPVSLSATRGKDTGEME